jgi:hypothetical protein
LRDRWTGVTGRGKDSGPSQAYLSQAARAAHAARAWGSVGRAAGRRLDEELRLREVATQLCHLPAAPPLVGNRCAVEHRSAAGVQETREKFQTCEGRP